MSDDVKKQLTDQKLSLELALSQARQELSGYENASADAISNHQLQLSQFNAQINRSKARIDALVLQINSLNDLLN